MKKKICLIIATLILIVINVITIINAQSIIDDILESLNSLPVNLSEKMLEVYSNTKLVVTPAIICIVVDVLSLIILITNKMNKKRNLLLAFLIINCILANKVIGSIISIVAIVFCATIKFEKIVVPKAEMPKLNRTDIDSKSVILAVVLIAIYFSQLLFSSINIDSFFLSLMFSLLIDVIIMIIAILIFKKNLKRDISYLKNNFRAYVSYTLPKLGIMYLIYFGTCIITAIVCQNISVNQQMLNNLPVYYLLPAASIIAPITEELVFRGCFRRLIKNDKVFIVISGLIFGLLHMMHEVNLINVIFLSLPYCLLGGFFAYLYTKTNNITINIATHSFHNTAVILLQIMLL